MAFEQESTLLGVLILIATLHELAENHANTPNIDSFVILFNNQNDLWGPIDPCLNLRSKLSFLLTSMAAALIQFLSHLDLEFLTCLKRAVGVLFFVKVFYVTFNFIFFRKRSCEAKVTNFNPARVINKNIGWL